ncbi:MAG: CPBP family intramembrane metalloprotease [Chloroflexia bacterium]|nr:CPBP family intramembrane metalloprotease [Chloroflexia bacterium]
MENARAKIGALIEVVAVFLLAVLLFHGLRISPLGQLEGEIIPQRGLYFVEYGAVLVILLLLLKFTGRDWERYGLTLKRGKLQLRVIAVGLAPMLALGGVLGMVDWKTWAGAAIASLVAVGALILIGGFLKEDNPGTPMLLALLALGPGLVESGAVGGALLRTLYFYLFVGPAEELLFRGYIQSRLNEVYPKSRRLFGVAWGWGPVMAAALFGLWHVAWRPLEGGAWFQALWTFFAGLIFGYVRERSQSVVPSSLLHSVMNYVPLFDLLGG